MLLTTDYSADLTLIKYTHNSQIKIMFDLSINYPREFVCLGFIFHNRILEAVKVNNQAYF